MRKIHKQLKEQEILQSKPKRQIYLLLSCEKLIQCKFEIKNEKCKQLKKSVKTSRGTKILWQNEQ